MNHDKLKVGPLKRPDDEPTFDEAWQAQALGIADTLVSASVISAKAWSEALGAELRNAVEKELPDDTDTYYAAVLAALETLLCQSDVTTSNEIGARAAQWRQAYLNTPHGHPVELAASDNKQL